MRLTVNGEPREAPATTLLELWQAESPDPHSVRGCAIAVNGRIVRAPLWAETALREGDAIEIVRAFAGG
jgi:sulfur carrier protein